MIDLTKDMDPADLSGVTKFRIGGAWDTSTGMSGGLVGWAKKKIGSDLDVLCIGANASNRPVRYIGLDNLDPLNGAVVHSGDNTTGKGEGDDETIDVDLDRVSPTIHYLHFVIAAFKVGSSFNRAKNVEFNFYDGSDGRYDLVAQAMPELFSSKNIHQVLKVYREGNGWKLSVPEVAGSITQGDTDALMRFALR